MDIIKGTFSIVTNGCPTAVTSSSQLKCNLLVKHKGLMSMQGCSFVMLVLELSKFNIQLGTLLMAFLLI